jgi:hypothetical protein
LDMPRDAVTVCQIEIWGLDKLISNIIEILSRKLFLVKFYDLQNNE